MPRGIWALEWLNENSQRAYPLADYTSQQDTTGDFTIPDDFIVELYVATHAGLTIAPGRFHIHWLIVFSAGYSITIGYTPDNGDPVDVATAVVAKASHSENTVYGLTGIGDFSDTVGQIVIGNTANIDEQPVGQYEFDLDGAALDPDVIRPIIRGVSSITVRNGTETSEAVTGNIELQAGTNISLQLSQISGQDPVIRIDAIDGTGFNEDCGCTDDNDEAPCIRSINGVPPDAQGNFTLLGDDCLQISTIAYGLRLSDECSAPCCGCTELEAIMQDLEQFGDAARTLQTFVTRLSGEVSQMNMVVLGTRISDYGCLTQ